MFTSALPCLSLFAPWSTDLYQIYTLVRLLCIGFVTIVLTIRDGGEEGGTPNHIKSSLED